ncbi:MAG: hypothetical protein H6Q16_1185 [Bacteroidetes bacterium]|nr:hypothetical protein [Bacteroidota bacterium]
MITLFSIYKNINTQNYKKVSEKIKKNNLIFKKINWKYYASLYVQKKKAI